MALVDDLDQFPSGPLAGETRRLIDLALSMSGETSDNSGITSTDQDGDSNTRPLHAGGRESWKFIRRARDRCWEKAGLDPAVLNCPEDANDIHFGGSSDQSTYHSAVSPNLSQVLALDLMPQGMSIDELSFLAQTTGLDWGFGAAEDFGFDSTL